MRRLYSRLRLSEKIILPFLALFLSILLLAILSFGSWFTGSLQENLSLEVATFADRVLQDVKAAQLNLETQVKLLSNQEELQQAIAQQNQAALLRILLPLKAELRFDWIQVVDAEANVLGSLRDIQLNNLELQNVVAIKAASSGANVNDIITTEDGHYALFASAAPVKSRERVLGGMMIGRLIDHELLQSIAAGSSKEILATTGNRIIATSSAELLARAGQAPTATNLVQRLTFQGREYLAKSVGLSGLQQTDLILVVLYPIAKLSTAQQHLWVQLSLLFVVGAGFVVLCGSFIARTLARQLNAQFQQLQEALQNLKKAQAQLIQVEKMSSLGQMVAGIAHEINNPVNFIEGNVVHLQTYVSDLLQLADLYQAHSPQPDRQITNFIQAIDLEFLRQDAAKILSSIQLGAQRISQIVLSLRNFSRLDESDRKSVNLNEGIENTLLVVNHRLSTIQITKRYGDLPLVECYPAQLNQVFLHLLTNAIDAVTEQQKAAQKEQKSYDAEIAIATHQLNEEQIQIRIQDNGCGIPLEVQSKIFDPFFTTKPVGQGTGLGLSIAYQIIEQHHGRIVVQSQVGSGTEFIITLLVEQPTILG